MAVYERQPGETYFDLIQRRSADYAAWQRGCDERAAAHRAEHGESEGMNVSLAAGVGTFDGNGNPKGSGWW